jgi:branched-chain amino acid transport system permease protein
MRCGDFKESYIKDEVIFQSFFVKFWLALFFIFLILIPFAVDAYILYVANLIGFAIIGAVGLNILTGFTGQISLGHAAFVGVGGYTAAILMTRLNFSFWLALPCAGLVAALAGLVIGIPSLRVKGLYLCMATLAAQFIFEFIFIHWESMTQGIRGINVPSPVLGNFSLDTEKHFYFLTLVIVILAVGFARNLVRSRVGRAFVAIRDRDLAAEIMGISLFRYKLTAFAISSFPVGEFYENRYTGSLPVSSIHSIPGHGDRGGTWQCSRLHFWRSLHGIDTGTAQYPIECPQQNDSRCGTAVYTHERSGVRRINRFISNF